MREILTFKSGKFYFCDIYDETFVNSQLIRINVLNETVVDLPILPELSSHLEPGIMYSSISGTASIEGNPIIEEDVRRLAEGEDIETYTKKDKQEIINLIVAYNRLSGIEPSGQPYILTEDLILELHEIITNDVPDERNKPGYYRNGLVHVGDRAHGGRYTPPKILDDIKNLMTEFIDWINSEPILSLNPFVRAALAHYHFCLIHPFWDGNGRTARLIEAILLQSSNIKYVPKELSNYYYRNVDEYYIAFSKSIKLNKDVTPFIVFMLDATDSSLTKIKDHIIYFIRKFSLRDFFDYKRKQKNITERQYTLLSLLLDSSNLIHFTLKNLTEKRPFSLLYDKVTIQTARRDLQKLVKENLIAIDKENKYFLNFHVLG